MGQTTPLWRGGHERSRCGRARPRSHRAPRPSGTRAALKAALVSRAAYRPSERELDLQTDTVGSIAHRTRQGVARVVSVDPEVVELELEVVVGEVVVHAAPEFVAPGQCAG